MEAVEAGFLLVPTLSFMESLNLGQNEFSKLDCAIPKATGVDIDSTNSLFSKWALCLDVGNTDSLMSKWGARLREGLG